MILSAKQFRSYIILKIGFAADFCFWAEQWLNETYILCLGLAETLKVPNNIMVGNSLRFPMITHTTYSDARFDSYEILNSG
jgi:hypothetical protein